MSTIEANPTTVPDRLKFTPSPQAEGIQVIQVDPTGTYSSGSNFYHRTTEVNAGGQIALMSHVSKSHVNYVTAKVYTYNPSGTSISAFTSGSPPYDASPNVTTYTLNVTGTIIISLSPTWSEGEQTNSANGTINVGGQAGADTH